MDGLSPHIDYRVGFLRHEAQTRRLAASATPPRAPKPPRGGHRALGIATALLCLAVVVGASGTYLVVAASPVSTPAADTSTPAVEKPADVPTVDPEGAIRPLPRAGGLLTHR